MKLPMLLLLCLFTTGCAVEFGAHVKKFDVRGQTLVKCIVVVPQKDHKLAQESLEVCRDAFGMEHTAKEQLEMPNEVKR